jgi:hypothetical protein
VKYRYWTEEKVIRAMQDHAREHGTLRQNDWPHGQPWNPAHSTVYKLFGSWNAAMEAAGLPVNNTAGEIRWTRERILEVFLDWLLVHGDWPRRDQWKLAAPGRPCTLTVTRKFGTWTDAKIAAGWNPVCLHCHKPFPDPRANRKFCSARCCKQGKRPVVRVVTCAGCAREGLEDYTIGCDTCSDRRGNREWRVRELAAA